jgi:ATP-binding protein involved in chromosome partitioning
MKIAIPVSYGQLSAHFGHCEQFALVEVDPSEKKIIGTEYAVPPPHEPGVLPRWLHEQGVDVIIAGGMGQRAQQLFAQNGIGVVVGARCQAAEEVVTNYLQGTLEAGMNPCDH